MMILSVLKWYLVLLGIGLIGFPFGFRFLKSLPGRAYAFARILGLLLLSYAYWLLCSLGLLTNHIGSLILVVLVLAIMALCLYVRQWSEISAWLRNSRKFVVVTEVLFLFAFVFILAFRLSSPDISGTEKPMEMTFINGILRSDTFPPHDSWLSGYAISYYYFGYIMTAILIMLSGVASTVGFNLMLATVFALAAVAAFGLVNDMLERSSADEEGHLKTHLSSLLAPLFVLFCGNLEGFFEVLHSKGFFWNADGTSSFWQWLGLRELSDAPTRLSTWDPTGRSGIWWWRASRVLSDYGVDGGFKEVIDEFPFFSFQLGDLHPHVTGIPFVIFAIAIALNVIYSQCAEKKRGYFFVETLLSDKLSLRDSWIAQWVCSADFWLTSVCLGALLFINTWDFPFYFGLYCLAATLAYVGRNGWKREALTVFFETALPLGAACILLYSLFLNGLSSQAGGIIPSGVFTTRTIHFLIMFGLFVVPLLWWLIGKARKCGRTAGQFALKSAVWSFLALGFLELIVFAALCLMNSSSAEGTTMKLAGSSFAGVQGLTAASNWLIDFFTQRLTTVVTLLILFLLAGCVLALLRSFRLKTDSADALSAPVDVFCGLMVLIAALLVIFPEFFYLRDFFGTRMNTIFKFYYQAWILFALAAAYVCAGLWRRLRGASRAAFGVTMVLLICMASTYPFWCTQNKLSYLFSKPADSVTLDGASFLQRSRPDEWLGIEWLEQADYGVILEKVGDSYTADNAASTFSGLPAVQGPANHESQWRGGYAEMGSRSEDVKRIYETRNWETARTLLEEYQVRYIYIGSAELGAYNVQEQKFEKNLPLVFNTNGCKIYQVY